MGEGGGRISLPSEGGGGGGGDAAGGDEVNVDQGIRQPPLLHPPTPLRSIRTPKERPSTATVKKPALLKSVYHSVDYKGGDIQGVGPLNVEDEKECRSLCVRDGRCLKWTLQLKEMVCWLKDAGGTRNEDVPGLTSGVVRDEEDTTIPKPRYGKEPPPPPLQCCPDAAGEPPAGVHALDLWDDEPGSDWTTSYALGNGYLGAMLGMRTFKDTMFMSHGSLWSGKGKHKAGGATFDFPLSPDRYDKFRSARESLLDGDVHAAQEAAGRMPTSPEGFVGSFEYAGELLLEFGEGGGQQAGGEREKGPVDGYIRHLHLNNGTAEATFSSKGPPDSGGFGLGLGLGFGTSRGQREGRLVHRREAFASNVDGVLAMRLSCKEEESGRGCLR
ncbi:GH95 [Ectocarpus sp. CCAP 1310/34]|nr:GH95 [Ectocarpus sp. CCAP 1310/34]